MNELPDDVPALSAEASEFLKRHATTGEPSLPALERVKARLPTPRARLIRFARVAVPLAAALTIVVLSAWFWSQRMRPTEPVAEAPQPIVSEPAIPVMTLVDESAPEPKPAPLPDPKRDELREVYLRAYMLKDTDPARSRQLLEQIVAEGDPRWETVQKAKHRLTEFGVSVKAPRVVGREVDFRDLFLRAYQLRESSPAEAARVFQQVVDGTDPTSELHQKATKQLALLGVDLEDLFQRAYVIRDRQPEEAAKLFRQISEAKEASPTLREKAKRQLEALDGVADPKQFLKK
jgi:hypothetical protein